MEKITQKEWDKYVVLMLDGEGFTRDEIDALSSAFSADLKDTEEGEISGFFSTPIPGIGPEELKARMAELRDPSSNLSKGLKVEFWKYPDRLDKAEEILTEALRGDKEGLF